MSRLHALKFAGSLVMKQMSSQVLLRGESGIGHVDELRLSMAGHDPGKLVKDLPVGLLVGSVAVEHTAVAGEIALDAE
jgi:hypothetical protein